MNATEKALSLAGVAAAIAWAASRTQQGQAVSSDAVEAIIGAGGRLFDAARELIAGEEGLRLTAYQDTGGAWTIGYGHLVKAGERYHPSGPVRTISREEAEQLFDADIASARQAVRTYVNVPLTDNQRAALESLVFNIGSAAFKNSTLRKKLNERDYAGAANEFSRWVYDNGVAVRGLESRRMREREVFLA